MWTATVFPSQATVCYARAVCILWRWNRTPWISLLNVLLANHILPCHFNFVWTIVFPSPCKAPCVFFLMSELRFILFYLIGIANTTRMSSPWNPIVIAKTHPIVITSITRLSLLSTRIWHRQHNPNVITIKPDCHRQHNPNVIAIKPDCHHHKTRLSSPKHTQLLLPV